MNHFIFMVTINVSRFIRTKCVQHFDTLLNLMVDLLNRSNWRSTERGNEDQSLVISPGKRNFSFGRRQGEAHPLQRLQVDTTFAGQHSCFSPYFVVKSKTVGSRQT